MRTPFSLPGRKREFLTEHLRPADAAALSRLHAQGFSRPWSDGEFAALLEQDTVFGFAAREVGRPHAAPGGFVLARQAAGEGEILTIMVAPALRRCGLGWMLMDAVMRELYAQRAEALFLEVDETNRAATGLYRKLGFSQVGARPAYYEQQAAPRTTALVMRRDLG